MVVSTVGQSGRRSRSPFESRRPSDIDRVLAGQRMPSAREMIGLIHDVNPTGRESDKREAARRYAIKTRLQSLLLQRFADEMEVLPGDKEGIVLLRHKYLGLAASHAVVADLEENARAWVQMQVDLGVVERGWVSPAEEPRPRHPQRSQSHRRRACFASAGTYPGGAQTTVEVAAALEAGQSARASYDYEAARAAFERAHVLAPDAVLPMAALLDLLVNHLGLDQEALALAEVATSTSLQSPTSRAALALAAARAGDRERAEAWGRDLEGAQAAEVQRSLAAAALRDGDLDFASTALERARKSFATDPERILIEKQLEQARAAAVADDEAELARRVKSGALVEAAQLARRIVERHPGSKPARAVLKHMAAQDRLSRQRGALEQARAAAARADCRQARQALARARELGASAAQLEAVEASVAGIEAKAHEAARRRTLDAVIARLACPSLPAEDRQGALACYARLSGRDREAVRAACSAPELPWLDEVAPGAPNTLALGAAAMAACAAAKLLDGDDAEAAERALAPHRILLAEHTLGRDLLARLGAAQTAHAQERALAALERARAALQARDLDEAKVMLDSIGHDSLPAAASSELERTWQALAAARQHKACMELVDQCLARHHVIRARQLVLERLESCAEDERALLRERLVQIDPMVRQAHLGIDCVPPRPYPASEASEMVTNYLFDRGVDTGLLPDGRTAVLMSAGQGQLAVRLVDVDTGEVKRLFAWAMGQAIAPKSVGAALGRLWLADLCFQYTEIDCADWMPCRDCQVKPDATAGDAVEKCLAVPQAGMAWIKTRQLIPPYTHRLRLVDLASGRVVDLPEGDDEGDVYYIAGTRPALLAWFSEETTLILVSARGEDQVFIDLPPRSVALAVALAPSGRGYVVVVRTEQQGQSALLLVSSDANGAERSRLPLPGNPEGSVGVATVLPKQLVCVTYQATQSRQPRLAYLREREDHSLVVVADVEIPGLLGIMQDDAASTAVALCRSPRGARMTRLDDLPTAFPEAYDEIRIPRVTRFVDCSPAPEPNLENRLRSRGGNPTLSPGADITDRKLEILAEGVEHSLRAVTTYRMLRFWAAHERADRLLELMERQNTNNFFVRLALAEREALAGRSIDGKLEQDGATFGASDHVLHVRAVALLRQDRLDEVIALLNARQDSPTCRLSSLMALARALRAELSGEADNPETMERPSLETLVRRTFAADRALVRGDHEEVLRLLDLAWIRQVGEAQSMARLASAYLALAAKRDPVHRFRASTLLADFVDYHYARSRNAQLYLCQNTWTSERIEALTADAQTWLVAFTWKS